MKCVTFDYVICHYDFILLVFISYFYRPQIYKNRKENRMGRVTKSQRGI